MAGNSHIESITRDSMFLKHDQCRMVAHAVPYDIDLIFVCIGLVVQIMQPSLFHLLARASARLSNKFQDQLIDTVAERSWIFGGYQHECDRPSCA